MQIEQALYGETRGGHSLLDASKNDEVSSEIVQRLDLPDTAPPGVEWSPFVRGFPYRDRYLLSRTFLDTCASRGGMVFSHALIAPLDEITRTSNLKPLFELLTADERSRPSAETIDLASIETQPPDAADLLDTAEALTSTIELPVVRAGHVGFDHLVVALWGAVAARNATKFRFSFELRPARPSGRSHAGIGMYASCDDRTLDRLPRHRIPRFPRTHLPRERRAERPEKCRSAS